MNDLSSRINQVSSSPTVALNALAKEMMAKGENVINFTIGEPDFDTPEHIKEAAVRAIKDGFTKYTSPQGILPLREALSKKFQEENNIEYTPEEIIVTSGAKDALYMLFQVLLNPGDEVIIFAPYWVSYPEQVKLAGGIPKIVDTKEDFSLPGGRLEESISAKTKALIINSPCNPSGAMCSQQDLKRLVEIAKSKNLFLVSDEIYEKILYEGEPYSPASLDREAWEHTVTINGVSKTYAMTGWRIGYAAGPKEIVGSMKKLQSQSVSSPSSISQKAALAALEGPQTPVEQMVQKFRERRDYLMERLKKSSFFAVRECKGAFYIFPSFQARGKFTTSTDLCQFLLKEGKVATVPGSAFGREGHIRISYATSLENIKEGIDRIQSIVEADG